MLIQYRRVLISMLIKNSWTLLKRGRKRERRITNMLRRVLLSASVPYLKYALADKGLLARSARFPTLDRDDGKYPSRLLAGSSYCQHFLRVRQIRTRA